MKVFFIFFIFFCSFSKVVPLKNIDRIQADILVEFDTYGSIIFPDIDLFNIGLKNDFFYMNFSYFSGLDMLVINPLNEISFVQSLRYPLVGMEFIRGSVSKPFRYKIKVKGDDIGKIAGIFTINDEWNFYISPRVKVLGVKKFHIDYTVSYKLVLLKGKKVAYAQDTIKGEIGNLDKKKKEKINTWIYKRQVTISDIEFLGGIDVQGIFNIELKIKEVLKK